MITVIVETERPAPEAQLRACISRFGPKDQKLFRSLRSAMRKQFPTANELAYDYADSVLIAYSPTDHGIESIVSIALRSEGVRLYLMRGPQLSDPKRLLKGAAKLTRFVEVQGANELSNPDVQALIAGAIELASVPFPSTRKGSLIIMSAASKSRRGKQAE
jgi:hypothetical protein